MKWNQIGILSKSFPAGKDFSSNSGDEKNEIMKFLGFSKIWDENSLQIYFSKKKKIFEMKYILRISSQTPKIS